MQNGQGQCALTPVLTPVPKRHVSSWAFLHRFLDSSRSGSPGTRRLGRSPATPPVSHSQGGRCGIVRSLRTTYLVGGLSSEAARVSTLYVTIDPTEEAFPPRDLARGSEMGPSVRSLPIGLGRVVPASQARLPEGASA